MSGTRLTLRAATSADHDRLDALFAGFDLGDRASYVRFLLAHAAALLAVEGAIDAAGMAALLPDWAARRRGGLIGDDLAALGIAVPARLPAPALAGEAAAWGAAYVLEGSRLGGAVLAGRVAPGLPTGYLAAPQPKGAWRTFVTMLDQAVASPDETQAAAAGASAVFALFEAAARAQLGGRQRLCVG